MPHSDSAQTPGILKSEMALWGGFVSLMILSFFGQTWMASLSNLVHYSILFVWLFTIMLWLSFGVVKHADCLAVILGEPYGTLVLTLAVISIEVVMISAVMLTGDNNPALARDTMFSVLMIVLNGLLGLTLLLGGLRHKEQEYNISGANAYLGVLIPLSILGLIIPRLSTSAPGGQTGPLMGTFLVIMSGGLYAVFLLIQTTRHSSFFEQPIWPDNPKDYSPDHGELHVRSTGYHVLFLLLTMLPIVLLSKKMAILVNHGIATLAAPPALGGFFVAILVLAPEGLGAIKSALDNQLQRTVNIALGSALATIGLTIPAVLGISLFTGRKVEMGLEPIDITLLILTLFVTTINFGRGRTNILQGAVHLIIFFAFIMLMFDSPH